MELESGNNTDGANKSNGMETSKYVTYVLWEVDEWRLR